MPVWRIHSERVILVVKKWWRYILNERHEHHGGSAGTVMTSLMATKKHKKGIFGTFAGGPRCVHLEYVVLLRTPGRIWVIRNVISLDREKQVRYHQPT